MKNHPKRYRLEYARMTNLSHLNTGSIFKRNTSYEAATKTEAIEPPATTEQLDLQGLQSVISQYQYDGKAPLSADITPLLQASLKLLARRRKVKKVIAAIEELVERFEGFG